VNAISFFGTLRQHQLLDINGRFFIR